MNEEKNKKTATANSKEGMEEKISFGQVYLRTWLRMVSIHDHIIHMGIPILKRKKLLAKECLCVSF